MRSSKAWKPFLAPAFVAVLATGSAEAAKPAGAGAEVPATFAASASREARAAATAPSSGSALDELHRGQGLVDAIRVARCRARRGRGGSGRSASIASPSVIKIPNAKDAPKSAAKSSGSDFRDGYYDENGVFHSDAKSGVRESARD